MSVVQRCPNCGTTRATPGECEACHSAQARAYCTNHDPGIWLDGRTCPTCDERLAEAARKPRARPSARRGPSPMAASRAPARTFPPALPDEPPERPAHEVGGWAGHDRTRSRDDVAHDLGAAGAPAWLKILRAAMIARSMRTRAAPDVTRSVGHVSGCLSRVLLGFLIMVALLVGALYLLVGGML